MFTGIIEETGELFCLKKTGNSANVEIYADKVLQETRVGDSIAVNGTCLTVTGLKKKSFTADVSGETLKITAISSLNKGAKVNLERALRLSDRLSGHLVMGHVDCTGTILDRTDSGDFSVFQVLFNPDFSKYVIRKGSIAVDGISLTVGDTSGDRFSVNIIPHTIRSTNLQYLKRGNKVNLEFDLTGKYIENMLLSGRSELKKGGVSKEMILKAGFFGGKIL